MKPEIKQQWVEALESGEYRQGNGVLQTADDRYCCLGVLSDLAVKAGVIEKFQATKDSPWEYGVTVYDSNCAVLHDKVIGWAGLDSDIPYVSLSVANRFGTAKGDKAFDFDTEYTTLVHLNDGAEFSFANIAKVIQEAL